MITINKTRPNTKTWQYAYITLTVDGDTCQVVVSTPVVPDLQAYCDAREDEYKVNVLGAMYPDARWQDTAGKTDLEKFERWIIDGHTNAKYEDESGKSILKQVIKKVPWVDMFTSELSIEERVAELEAKVNQTGG